MILADGSKRKVDESTAKAIIKVVRDYVYAMYWKYVESLRSSTERGRSDAVQLEPPPSSTALEVDLCERYVKSLNGVQRVLTLVKNGSGIIEI